MKTKEIIKCDSSVYLTPDTEKELSDRLARIRGHVEGVRGMLLRHEDCDAMLVQLAAVKRALDEVTLQLLEGHMETCVLESAQKGKANQALTSLKRALAQVLRS
ncbi:MAG: metal-sensitive transcriptional regulator [candidate division Zixibacteria bacterium]|nr:metal-sensitive transcriptional regulator [candidate division Zixibacteria bacterium]